MKLIDIDVIGLQAAQRVISFSQDSGSVGSANELFFSGDDFVILDRHLRRQRKFLQVCLPVPQFRDR
jgi:hypothetical protein